MKVIEVESMPHMLAFRRVDRTSGHPFPPQRRQMVPQARDPLLLLPSLFHKAFTKQPQKIRNIAKRAKSNWLDVRNAKRYPE